MIRVDFERFLDEATVGDYVKVEDGGTSIRWLRDFWARFVVGEGGPLGEEEARRVLDGLSLRQFRELRREGELRDVAVPPSNGSG